MANEFLTLLDIAAANSGEGLRKLIEKDIVIAPEVNRFPAKTISGVSFDTVIREALPTTDYVVAGNGIAASKSRYAKKTVECKYREGQMRVYKAHALAHKDGAEAILAKEMDGMIKAVIRKLGKTIIYGNNAANNSVNGFPGALQVVDANMVVDAGGTTAGTGSSVYAFKVGEEMASLIFGNEKALESLQEWILQQVTGEDGNLTSAYCNDLSGWEGVAWENPFCVGRIKKLTADTGKTMSDDFGYDLLEKFHKHLGQMPDFFVATPRSANQLRKSRTPTTESGKKADWPTDVAGIPLLVSNSISDTESLTL